MFYPPIHPCAASNCPTMVSHEGEVCDEHDVYFEWLECPMCGKSRSFRIHPQDDSRGYCRTEAKTWVLRPNNNGLPDGYYWYRLNDDFEPEVVKIERPWVSAVGYQRTFKLENCEGEFIAVEPPPWTTPLIHEDELPSRMTTESYDRWHAASRVIDGVRMGPQLSWDERRRLAEKDRSK